MSPTPYWEYLKWLNAHERAQAERAWQYMLAGLKSPTLVTRPEPTLRPEAPEHVTLELSDEVTQELQQRARQHGLTMSTMVQGAWALVLGRLTGRDDVVFGTTLSGRSPEIPGAETMAGFSSIPCRCGCGGIRAETLVQMLARVQDHQAAMTQHQHVRLADIHRLTGLGELFDTVTVFENYPNGSQAAVNGLRATVIEGHDAWHYPLRLIAVPGPKLTLQLWYRPDRLDHNAAKIGGSSKVLTCENSSLRDSKLSGIGLDHGTARQVAQRVAGLLETVAADLAQPIGEINGRWSEKLSLPRTTTRVELIQPPGEIGEP